MKYKRVQGGERTEKSGIPWDKEELIKVYNLFVEIKGVGIHERNPRIQKLAGELKRSVRSTEAQMLMFRALSRELEYSHKNMNKLCIEIWNDNIDKNAFFEKQSNYKEKYNMPSENLFLRELIQIQQDGKHAISSPNNWITNEPVLEVGTEVDFIIDKLQEQMLIGERKNKIARWHFLIGSPGNGKSAAIGRLCRKLINENSCKIFDENNIPINELSSTQVPYALKVYENGFNFPSALIVQDASVVRNPFNSRTDPAEELINTLKGAWTYGRSLVICTNRGVLEKAHSDFHMDKDINCTPWFKVIYRIIDQNGQLAEFDCTPSKTRNTVFENLKVSYSYLDNRSLLMQQDIFLNLVKKAIEPSKWECCGSCNVKKMCPFKTNRDWLANEEACNKVIKLLKRAEVLSGQVIVFREALSIISLILAGCPIDYNNISPCDWVKSRVKDDDIFSLAVRRIYMLLYASSSPYGFESIDKLKFRQLEYFKMLYGNIKEDATQTSNIIRNLIQSSPPSTDIGVKRILGEYGIISQLDPTREILTNDFYNKWDSEYAIIEDTVKYPFFSEIERLAISTWKDIERQIEGDSDKTVTLGNWTLKRWSSNFLLHFGALIEGHSAAEKEIDKFSILLNLVLERNRTAEEKSSIRHFGDEINNLLNSAKYANDGHSNSCVQLSESVLLTGQWVQNKLKPKIVENQASGSVSISLEFTGNERAVVSASMYLWLCRMSNGHLDPSCFPQELLTGIRDARIRAAAKGKYALENSEVKLIIEASTGSSYELERFDGEVEIKKN